MVKFFQFLIIPLLVFASHYTSLLTYTLVRNIKARQYVTPLTGWRFDNDNWFAFIFTSLLILQPFYLIGGIILFTSYKISLDHFNEMYPAVILNLGAMSLWTVAMMYWRVRELPTRDGWIALSLIIIASLLAMNAGKNIAPH